MNRASTISDEGRGTISQVSTESSMHATDMLGRPLIQWIQTRQYYFELLVKSCHFHNCCFPSLLLIGFRGQKRPQWILHCLLTLYEMRAPRRRINQFTSTWGGITLLVKQRMPQEGKLGNWDKIVDFCPASVFAYNWYLNLGRKTKYPLGCPHLKKQIQMFPMSAERGRMGRRGQKG